MKLNWLVCVKWTKKKTVLVIEHSKLWIEENEKGQEKL